MMKIKKQALILFGMSVMIFLWLFYSDYVRIKVANMIQPPKYVDFPLGQNKKVSYQFSSFLEKPYVIDLTIEEKATDSTFDYAEHHVPFDITVTCFQLFNQKKSVLFHKRYVRNEILITSMGGGFTQGNIQRAAYLKTLRLGRGKYQCDFEDNSSTELKDKFVLSYVQVMPKERWKY